MKPSILTKEKIGGFRDYPDDIEGVKLKHIKAACEHLKKEIQRNLSYERCDPRLSDEDQINKAIEQSFKGVFE